MIVWAGVLLTFSIAVVYVILLLLCFRNMMKLAEMGTDSPIHTNAELDAAFYQALPVFLATAVFTFVLLAAT